MLFWCNSGPKCNDAVGVIEASVVRLRQAAMHAEGSRRDREREVSTVVPKLVAPCGVS